LLLDFKKLLFQLSVKKLISNLVLILQTLGNKIENLMNLIKVKISNICDLNELLMLVKNNHD